MILSIDTFSDIFGISLIDEDKVVLAREYLKPKPFSEILIPEIDDALKKVNIDFSKLKAVCVNIGVGSNTGLRVGVITAKTLAYSLNIPIYYYKTLDVLIWKYSYFCGDVVAVINIGKGKVAYKLNNEDMVITFLDEFKSRFFERENLIVLEKNLQLNWKNSIAVISSLSIDGCLYALKNNQIADIMFLEPIYHD